MTRTSRTSLKARNRLRTALIWRARQDSILVGWQQKGIRSIPLWRTAADGFAFGVAVVVLGYDNQGAASVLAIPVGLGLFLGMHWLLRYDKSPEHTRREEQKAKEGEAIWDALGERKLNVLGWVSFVGFLAGWGGSVGYELAEGNEKTLFLCLMLSGILALAVCGGIVWKVKRSLKAASPLNPRESKGDNHRD